VISKRHVRAAWYCAALSVMCLPRTLWAQFTDPRTYTVAPVGINQLEIDYAHAEANAALDTSLVVGGANFQLNQATVSYTHNVGVLDHVAWVKASVPFARLSGSVAGTSISGSQSGTGDLSIQVAALLMGGRVLSTAELAKYQPARTWGASLTISAPTGEYNPDKLLNLGSNRWSFKPEIGVAHPFGRERTWEVDAYINAIFFTDNTNYRGVEILRQEPLPGFEAHLSHDFSPNVWASLDARYSFRGDTVVDSTDQDSSQRNLTAGAEASWSPAPGHALSLVIAKAVVHDNAPAYRGFVVRYAYSWAGERT
jgi:hypothetical protein